MNNDNDKKMQGLSYEEFWGTYVEDVAFVEPNGETVMITVLIAGTLGVVPMIDDTYDVLHLPTKHSLGAGFSDPKKAFSFARWLTMAFNERFERINSLQDALNEFSSTDLAVIKSKRTALGGH